MTTPNPKKANGCRLEGYLLCQQSLALASA